MIAKTNDGIRKEFKLYKDGLEELNGYSPYKIAVRVLLSTSDTEFVTYSRINKQFNNEKQAYDYLKEYLLNNNYIIRKELI